MNDPNFPILLAEFLAKSAVIIALGSAISLLIRGVAASRKHRLWMLILSASLLIPFLLLLLPRWGILPVAVNQATPGVVLSAPAGPVLIPAPVETPVVGVVDASRFEISWPWILVSVWVGGIVIFMIRLIAASLFLRRIEKSAYPPEADVLEEFGRLALQNRVRRSVSLLISPNVKSPFTCGIWLPRIYLPDSEFQREEREMILLHELEHVRRFDSLAVCISRIFLTLNWVNPLAWIAIREVIGLREEACDQRVLSTGHDSRNYAEMLFRQAKATSTPLLKNCATAVAETGTIEHRIKMILNSNSNTPRKSILLFSKCLPVLMIAAIVGISIAGPDKPKAESGPDQAPVDVDLITKKLNGIIIPSLEFQDTPLKDAIAFLHLKSKELDSIEKDPKMKGVNLLLADPSSDFSDAVITLKLSNVPLKEAIRYTAQLAGGTLKVEEYAVIISSAPAGGKEDAGAGIEIQKKLKSIIIPSLDLNNTELRDAIQFLQMKSVELDASTDDRSKKGVNFIIKDAPKDAGITLKLSNIPLGDAIRYMTAISGMKYEVEAHAVVITPEKG